ncbi:hypothetical protein HPF13_1214, partial [Helicobacter pylori]
KKDSKKERL